MSQEFFPRAPDSSGPNQQTNTTLKNFITTNVPIWQMWELRPGRKKWFVHSHGWIKSRPGIWIPSSELSLLTTRLVFLTCKVHMNHPGILLKWRFWFSSYEVEPETQHFQQACRWERYCWSLDRILSNKAIYYNIFIMPWAILNWKIFSSSCLHLFMHISYIHTSSPHPLNPSGESGMGIWRWTYLHGQHREN